MDESTSGNTGSKGISYWWLLPLVGGVLLLWLLQGFGAYRILDNWQVRGTFGDMFGAVNSLFAGLAFAGLFFAILLQRKELQMQRDQLELNRRELEGQKKMLEAQNRTLKKQNFETNFFQLLRIYQETVDSAEIGHWSNRDWVSEGKGRRCLKKIYGQFRNIYDKNASNNPEWSVSQLINNSYLRILKSHDNELGYCLRNLYNLLKFLEQSDIENKRFYRQVIREQLGPYEVLHLFYYCLSDQGHKEFKPLVEKFGLLENLLQQEVLDESHLTLNAPSAFGPENGD